MVINRLSLNHYRKKCLIFIFMLWLAATAYNITKPYHIDDTAHLEIAEWILSNPLNPMSGNVNWSDSSDPIHKLNQPHLYSYLLAGFIKLFGTNEIATHIFQSIFTFLSILFFFKIAYHYSKTNAWLMTVLFVFCPAFFVGQNLMVDIPLVSLWIIYYYILITDDINSALFRYLLAGIVASTALLIKYSSLALLPALPIVILFNRHYKFLILACIPVIALLLWSLFNYVDYGSVHILGRPSQYMSTARITRALFAWITCAGGMSIFNIVVIPGYSKRLNTIAARFANLLIFILLFILMLIIALFLLGYIKESFTNKILLLLFFANGLFIILAMSFELTSNLKPYFNKRANVSEFLLHYWFLSGFSFIVLFSPFMATRHFLLVLPPILLILGKSTFTYNKRFFKATAIAISIFLSIMVGISDYSFAKYYKDNAKKIANKYTHDRKVWFSGHWGWQWYARLAGMEQIGIKLLSEVRAGDLLVFPEKIHEQKILDRLSVKTIGCVFEQRPWYTFFSTAGTARFYESSVKLVPWNLSKKPFGPIKIYEILAVKKVNAQSSLDQTSPKSDMN